MAGVETRHRPIILSMTTPTGRRCPRRQCLCLGRAEGETATAGREDNEPHRGGEKEKLRAKRPSQDILWFRPAQIKSV